MRGKLKWERWLFLSGANQQERVACQERSWIKAALRLLILQQPLGGQDMRFLTAVLYISDNLARIGDAVVEVAQTVLQAAALYRQAGRLSAYSVNTSSLDQEGYLTDAFILRGLLLPGGEIQYILQTSLKAFVQHDAALAQMVSAGQNLVDLRYVPLCQDIMEMQAQHLARPAPQRDATFIQRITCLLWIAHKLAEMATDVSNICKQVIVIVT